MNFKKFATLLFFLSLSISSLKANGIKSFVGTWKGTFTEVFNGEKFTLKETKTFKIFQKTGLKEVGKIDPPEGPDFTYVITYSPSGNYKGTLTYKGRVISRLVGTWSLSGKTISISSKEDGADESELSNETMTVVGKNTLVYKETIEGFKSTFKYKRQ
jgi:hypothetical protein